MINSLKIFVWKLLGLIIINYTTYINKYLILYILHKIYQYYAKIQNKY